MYHVCDTYIYTGFTSKHNRDRPQRCVASLLSRNARVAGKTEQGIFIFMYLFIYLV